MGVKQFFGQLSTDFFHFLSGLLDWIMFIWDWLENLVGQRNYAETLSSDLLNWWCDYLSSIRDIE